MQAPILRKIFLGFIQVHILHHASKEPIYGSWMIDELKHHGYKVSAGTLYPILHNLEKDGLIECEKKTVEGKVRKYYAATLDGVDALCEAKERISELMKELY